ncbi:MAG TPA: glycosyltransferase family 1 protein [Candidatus Paceibacterota bacterium]|nr:glycosyltransferase family 1 protein [Candidatus Paceibacterota bacterium]
MDNRLPVIYVSPYYDPKVPSGANRRFDEICQRYSRDYGDRFTLIVARGKAPTWWNGKNLIEVDYQFDHPSKFTAAKQIAKTLDAAAPSIVVIESVPIPYRSLKRHVQVQVVYDFRYFTGDSKSFLYRLIFTPYLKWQWGRSQFLLTCSDFSIAEAQKYLNYDPARVIKSYFGIDEKVLGIAATPAPAKDIDIIYVAHFEKRKNHEPLIRAIAALDKNLRVVFNGRDNGMQKELEALCRELGLIHVTFSGGKSDAELWQMYRRSRVFAYPSLYEGFGIPLIEALALEVPVAAADTQVFHEVGANLVSYFDPHDPDAIAACLKDLLDTPRVPAPEAVRAHLEKFFWENIYKKMVEDTEAGARPLIG